MTIIKEIDYNTHYTQLIHNTYDDATIRLQFEPLWHIIDVFIDKQARCKDSVYGGADLVYTTVEDFIMSKGLVENIPPLYKRLFAARPGFIAYVKFPIYISKEWLAYFAAPIQPRDLSQCAITMEFRRFVENQGDEYWSVLSDLELFGFPYTYSDDGKDECFWYEISSLDNPPCSSNILCKIHKEYIQGILITMSLIEGIDYNLEGSDYDTRCTQSLRNTFDDPTYRLQFEPLWHIIDVFIDKQARCRDTLYGDAELVYTTVEDFVISKGLVENIPPLYKMLFAARPGFLSQAKFPMYIRQEWLAYFPVPVQPRNLSQCELTTEFRDFVQQNYDDLYWSVLVDLELFGFPSVYSDDECDSAE